MPSVLCIAAGYLLGSISSTWIVVRLLGKQDMRGERDGSISAASVYYRLGALPYAIAVLMDIAIAATAVLIARALTGSNSTAMLAGFFAMAGHNWSPFLHFKGGQGATSMAGVLLVVMPLPLCYGLAAAALFRLFSRRAGLGTVVGVLAISFSAMLLTRSAALAFYPLSLLSLMLIKRLQLARNGRGALGSAK